MKKYLIFILFFNNVFCSPVVFVENLNVESNVINEYKDKPYENLTEKYGSSLSILVNNSLINVINPQYNFKIESYHYIESNFKDYKNQPDYLLIGKINYIYLEKNSEKFANSNYFSHINSYNALINYTLIRQRDSVIINNFNVFSTTGTAQLNKTYSDVITEDDNKNLKSMSKEIALEIINNLNLTNLN